MILSPLVMSEIPTALGAFLASLEGTGTAQAAVERIGFTLAYVDSGDNITLSQCPEQRQEAIELAQSFGMSVSSQPPEDGFTWDGQVLSGSMEPSVIIHDVAHWQVCAPERRHIPDFGLGAGPETGLKKQADQWMSVHGIQREMEEAMASLLGILWEVELGHPAILAFLEQNWLEGGASLHNRQHFLKVFNHLQHYGLLDTTGRPTRIVRTAPDTEFLDIFITPNVS
ncbi:MULTISPECIES: hypothetical protein [unclassified Haematospirillum]|uniref:hypothetical protein n=1 Tax=unclassified Haematospirillum TaxID=2622088 RepID=UPI001FD83FF2|nr:MULTISPECIES: hypothetical protein [unclassified Haematospirillum]